MRKLRDYITEKLKISNSTNNGISRHKLEEIINAIIESLSYEIDNDKEGMVIQGKDLYVTKGLRIGIDSSTGEWEIGEEKEIMAKYDLVFNPEELTHAEQETFVTDKLEEKIRAALEK